MMKAGLGRHAEPNFTPPVTLLYDCQCVAEQAIRWTFREFILVHSLLSRTQHVPLALASECLTLVRSSRPATMFRRYFPSLARTASVVATLRIDQLSSIVFKNEEFACGKNSTIKSTAPIIDTFRVGESRIPNIHCGLKTICYDANKQSSGSEFLTSGTIESSVRIRADTLS